MRTIVYVDGFNLYYGALKGRPFKWLNLRELARLHLKTANQIVGIKYFTARLNAMPGDPGLPQRQALYLRALQTDPHTSIHFGHFLTKMVRMRYANPPATGSAYANVVKTEEKGSDVSLAVNLVNDAHKNGFDCAVIVSGDSDYLESVKIVKDELGKVVGVLNPQSRPCRVLQAHASFYKHLHSHKVAASLFPATMSDAKGTFTKPPTW